ncbi:hypothetical protein [Longimicrobium sp.]|jgi:hypothetical protein|uniref:hypothetical protein n=1 Tax=Longimicrobium sp. TaxID=2029185 RepID=UPI002ED99E1A
MRLPTLPLAARRALALYGAFLLAACDPGQATSPEAVVGSWRTVQQQGSGSQSLRTEQWLDLLAEGTYRWTTQVSGTGGRPGDGLIETFEHSGSWKIVGDRLGLRTMTGMGWRHGQGGYQADYAIEWNYQHRIEVGGDQMKLHYMTRPEQSILPYTLVFERMIETGPFPMGNGR